jgi:DNA-directed RNA polymerase specialized sigma24 family protein
VAGRRRAPQSGAWLTTTANHKAIDRIRRENRRDDKHKEAQMVYDDDPPEPLGGIDNDRLRLIFTSCHPALATCERSVGSKREHVADDQPGLREIELTDDRGHEPEHDPQQEQAAIDRTEPDRPRPRTVGRRVRVGSGFELASFSSSS